MVPPKNHPKWAALIQGRLDCKLNNAAASMLLFRLQSDVKAGVSPAATVRATDELHAFFVKYERMLEPEIKAIFD